MALILSDENASISLMALCVSDVSVSDCVLCLKEEKGYLESEL